MCAGRSACAGAAHHTQNTIDTVVSANRIVCGHTGSLRVENFHFARDMLAVRPPSRDPARRLFLTRAPARGRILRNEREVAAMLARFGFETVDTDVCSLDEQIALFAGARAVVAVHGAGIVNAQFRWPRPFTLVELFPPWYVHPPFAWMAQQLGWGYGAICGSRADASDSFVVDVDDLRDCVDAALAQPGSDTGRTDEELEVS